MTRLVLQMGISIDGFVAAPDGSQPWVGEPEDEAAQQWKLNTVRGADAHLMGRVTYKDMAAHWPGSDSEYAAPMNEIPKVVFSTTLQTADWPQSRIAGGDLAEEIEAIKAQKGGYVIAYGGAGLRALARSRQPGRRVSAQRPAGRPRRGDADLHGAARAAPSRARRGTRLRLRQRRPRLPATH
jgi:dihydrofolate reductase